MVREVSTTELEAMMREGRAVYLLDVREAWEHDRAALTGSVLVPLGELAGRVADVRPPAGALVVVYCHHGVRSLHGAAIVQGAGIGPVVSLRGGIDAWSREIDPAVPRY